VTAEIRGAVERGFEPVADAFVRAFITDCP